MSGLSTLAVIIPNYNHARFLEYRINSVLKQGDLISKIIILDDASTDESIQLLKKLNDHRIKLVHNSKNSGSVFKQWQKGLSLVEEESLVWIAESDDVAHDDFLNEILKVFVDPQIVLAYSRSIDIDDDGVFIGLSYRNLKWKNYSFIKSGKQEVEDHLYKQCTIPNVSAVVFRKNVIDNSFFKHNFKLCGDWYFYVRLLQHGKVAYLSKFLNYHRFHSETVRSKSSKSLDILKERLLIVDETCKIYNLSNYRYVLSMSYQIDLYIKCIKIADLKWPLFTKMFNVIKPYGSYFCGVVLLLIGKNIVKRLYQKLIAINFFATYSQPILIL